ncbi:hypothetical protein FH972_023353 [Carpinus fangiana]|uniref:Aspartyl/Glutamyl-tRNA(Gln) amidotransferase subunit B/E catalytic domain-containing protein n=1 Tax=Carpinus fangiana TaxID=176857 RepID=A0A5N6KUZ2_9ROSI|nr:hypothetical protein FH972_023353 [Carpinus fangiana]
MHRAPSRALLRALNPSTGSLICRRCLGTASSLRRNAELQSTTTRNETPQPLRKQIKEETRARKEAKRSQKSDLTSKDPRLEKWELTVGIEIHAELSTAHKLFSSAQTSLSATPNTHVAPFDAALPGTQPTFQAATLLPALRAALALNCHIQRKSSFDRKHYFWWDQPNGYQITQYYEPFAKNGRITLYKHDDIDPDDGDEITIGIKQIQMEQDTAKTVAQPPTTQLLDFNRVSHPLIEIITLPQIHSPKTAAALVRKIQAILKAVNANTTGMEMGGLRADVNVSVRDKYAQAGSATLEYAGVKGLGQRTEIKNLSSFKAVEDAIIAERERQISVLEAGGIIEGETRGWALGSTETKRLRGKEGEVDYRYMPDPDLGAVIIGDDLLIHLRDNMPMLPDESIKLLTEDPKYGLTIKDARTMVALDDGNRLDYFLETFAILDETLDKQHSARAKLGKTVANWVLHDIPTSLAATDGVFPYTALSNGNSTAPILADILLHMLRNEITTPTARHLLSILSEDPPRHIADVIDAESLRLIQMTDEEYEILAQAVVDSSDDMDAVSPSERRRH